MNLSEKLKLLVEIMPSETFSARFQIEGQDFVKITHKVGGRFDDDIGYTYRWRIYDSKAGGIIGATSDKLPALLEQLDISSAQLEAKVDSQMQGAAGWCATQMHKIKEAFGEDYIKEAKEELDKFTKDLLGQIEGLLGSKPEEPKPKLTVVKEEEDE